MTGEVTESDKMVMERLIVLENSIINNLTEIMQTGGIEDFVYDMIFDEIMEYICIASDRYYGEEFLEIIRSLKRVIEFLLMFPVKHLINKTVVEMQYERFSLVLAFTYVFFQLTNETLDEEIVDGFISYMSDTSVGNLYVIYLYRVCPEHIRNTYAVDATSLSMDELYHGIYSGFFELGQKRSAAVDRLFEMYAEDEIIQLDLDGFMIGMNLYIN